MNCKYCNSTNTIKFGTFSGIQRYYCKDCLRKFTSLDTLPMMKTPVNEISSAMIGMTLYGILTYLSQQWLYLIKINLSTGRARHSKNMMHICVKQYAKA